MIEIIKELSIEVTKPNIFQALVAKQYDMNTRFLKVTLMDCGNRIDVPLTETTKVVINAERKDGQSKGFDGVINEDGTVTVPLHSWMLELDGAVICDISVMDIAEDDNKKLTTTSFTLLVEKAAYGGNDITSDPQYDVLVQLLETCAEAGTMAEEALAKSNEANAKYDACVEATENANQAADNANSVRAEIEAGGFIESLKEQNKGGTFSVWVGTQAEKDAEEEKNNCLYIIEDDAIPVDFVVERGTSSADIIDAETQSVVGSINWNYKKMLSGECELFGYTTLNLAGFTSAGGGWHSHKLQVSFPFMVKGRVITGASDSLSVITNVGSGGDYASSDLRILTHTTPVNDSLSINANLVVKGFYEQEEGAE